MAGAEHLVYIIRTAAPLSAAEAANPYWPRPALHEQLCALGHNGHSPPHTTISSSSSSSSSSSGLVWSGLVFQTQRTAARALLIAADPSHMPGRLAAAAAAAARPQPLGPSARLARPAHAPAWLICSTLLRMCSSTTWCCPASSWYFWGRLSRYSFSCGHARSRARAGLRRSSTRTRRARSLYSWRPSSTCTHARPWRTSGRNCPSWAQRSAVQPPPHLGLEVAQLLGGVAAPDLAGGHRRPRLHHSTRSHYGAALDLRAWRAQARRRRVRRRTGAGGRGGGGEEVQVTGQQPGRDS
jgi:hypothetical protein